MTDRGDDRDLRSMFGGLREEERRRVPAFRPLWSEARRQAAAAVPRRVPMRWAAAGFLTGAAVLAAALALLLGPMRSGRSMADAIVLAESLSSWTAPTDVLLEEYGSDLVNSVPTLEFDSLDLPATASVSEAGGKDPVER